MSLARFAGCRRHTPALALACAVVVSSIASFARPAALHSDDVSPNAADGTVNGGSSPAGLMLAAAGDDTALYAVSLNAGVWKSVRGGPWRQLPSGPARACCLAVDPRDARHLAVGERNGLAVDVRLNGSGVWESRDAGEHWTYTLDPLVVPGCTSQSVPSVAFALDGTLFAATMGGIGRKPRGARRFDFSSSPPGIGPVTALAVGQTRIWARTRTHLLVSSDDGATWAAHTFPAECGGLRIAFSSRGDAFSLAAFDDVAFVPCKPNPDTIGNRNTLIIYRPADGRWTLQKLPSGDGTGLGGRRFVRSFVLADRSLPEAIGSRLQLFYGAGQEVHQALGLEADGTVRWDTPVQTDWAGPAHPSNHIHPDMWDVHIAPTFGKQDGYAAWIACDGGIFRAYPAPTAALGRVQQMKWAMQNDGLHTHHIHTLTVLPAEDGGDRIAYPTSDNDAWYRDSAPDARWVGLNALGDANWTAGDPGNPGIALMVRHSRLAVLGSFGHKVAGFTDGQWAMLNPDMRHDGPMACQVIQSLPAEAGRHPFLDVVMLVRPPLSYLAEGGKQTPVPGPLGSAGDGASALVRCERFAASPDANTHRFAGWSLAGAGMPAGTAGFWVSGGHSNPVYTAWARQEGTDLLFRKGRAGWERLALVDAGGKPFELVGGSQYGPGFVDPYDPGRIFALARSGVMVTTDGGASWHADAVLTALLTGSGKYPITAGEVTGAYRDAVIGSRANPLSTLAHVAFDPRNRGIIVAASPFTGVFLTLDGGRTWRTVTPSLPTPLTAVAAVAIGHDDLYAATEGRSLVRIRGWQQAPLAPFFEVGYSIVDGIPPVVALRDGSGKPIAGARVQVAARGADATAVRRWTARTDGNGAVRLESAVLPRDRVVELSYRGSPSAAPCETTIVVNPMR